MYCPVVGFFMRDGICMDAVEDWIGTETDMAAVCGVWWGCGGSTNTTRALVAGVSDQRSLVLAQWCKTTRSGWE